MVSGVDWMRMIYARIGFDQPLFIISKLDHAPIQPGNAEKISQHTQATIFPVVV
jgi:hypothetical protein